MLLLGFCGRQRDKVPQKIFIGLTIANVKFKVLLNSFAFNSVFWQRH